MRRRVLLVDLGGLTLELLEPRLEGLPTLRGFFQEGAWGALTGPRQPVFPCSFATLLTGMNPGKTGLFDFLKFPIGGYELLPCSPDLIRGETLIDRASRSGVAVGVLNVPFTTLSPESTGFVVSGDPECGEEFAWPEEVRRRLLAKEYSVPFGASYAPGRELAFERRCGEVREMRERAFRSLFGERDWSLGLFSVHWLGEYLHAFWKFHDPRHPAYRPVETVFAGRDPLREHLEATDRLLGEAVELVGQDGLVLVIGTWGHRLEHTRIDLNALLERRGFLRYRRKPVSQARLLLSRLGISKSRMETLAHRLDLWKLFHYSLPRARRSAVTGGAFLSIGDIDWARTRAVSTGYLGQIYLNVRGQRPQGVVPPNLVEAERDKIAEAVRSLEDPATGQPVADRVWRREEIYHGPELANAPDLVVEWKDGYSAEIGIVGKHKVITPAPGNHSSDHWHQSIFAARGAGVSAGRLDVRLEDLAPTLLHAAGVAPDPASDGRVLPLFG